MSYTRYCCAAQAMILHPISKTECYVARSSDTDRMQQINQLPRERLKSQPKMGTVYLVEYDDSWLVNVKFSSRASECCFERNDFLCWTGGELN